MKANHRSTRIQRAKYVVCDLLTTIAAIFLFNIYRYYGLHLQLAREMTLGQFITMPKLLLEDVLIPTALLGIYWLSGFYNHPFERSRLKELLITLITAFMNAVLIYFALLVNDPMPLRSDSYEMLVVLTTLLFCFTYIGRYSITQRTIDKFNGHQWSFRTIIIGNSRIARQKAFELCKSTSRFGYQIDGFVTIPGEHIIDDSQHVYSLDELPELVATTRVDQFVLAPETHDDNVTLNLLNTLYPLNVPIKIWPDTLSFVTQGIRLEDIFGEPFVDLTTPGCGDSTLNIKRMCDIMASILALLVLSPLFLTLAICVKATSKGPVFYSQERIGYRRKPFRIYKFRSMVKDAERNGPQLSSAEDARITPLGKVLRKYRLDEIPQFWNVLRGDMSLVGPRPERAHFINLILKEAPWFALLHQVRPGITSWGMVKYGYASQVSEMVRRARYDLIYLANMSILVDIKILIYTVKTVITGRGV